MSGRARRLAVGVIGCGMIGTDHLRTLTTAVSGVRVAAISDADPERAAQAARDGGVDTVHADPYALIGDSAVDAILVASSEETHAPFVQACIQAGKPVLCEKPLAPTVDECLQIIEAEAALGRQVVQVGYMRRFDPSYTEMKRVLDSGHLGEALFLHCIHRNADYPARYESEALVTATAVHDIDAARWLLGQEIVSATALNPRASNTVRDGFQDPQFIVLRSEFGVVIDVEIFVNARYGYDVRAELVGETGTVSLMPPATTLLRHAGMDGQPVLADARPRFASAFRAELQAWVDGAADDEVRGANAWDGYAAAAVAQACLDSFRTGTTTPVELITTPDLYTKKAQS